MSNVFDKSKVFKSVIKFSDSPNPRLARNRSWEKPLVNDIVFHVCSSVISRIVEGSFREVCSEGGIQAALTTRRKLKSLNPSMVDWSKIRDYSSGALKNVVDEFLDEVISEFEEVSSVKEGIV
jgi:hypothetical protein